MSKRRAEALRTNNKRSSSYSNTQRSSLIDEPSTSSATMTSLNNEDSYIDSNQERELQQTYSMNLDSQNSDVQSEKNIFKNFILLSKDGLKSVYKCKLCTKVNLLKLNEMKFILYIFFNFSLILYTVIRMRI